MRAARIAASKGGDHNSLYYTRFIFSETGMRAAPISASIEGDAKSLLLYCILI